MKCDLIAVTVISVLISSADLKPLNRSGDKLNLLDKQGYEVISDAEEILAPMPSEDHGVENLSTNFSPPEVLLYGRFYVLRKKSLLSDAAITGRSLKADNFLRKSYPPSAQQYLEYRSKSRSTSPQSVTSTTTTKENINFFLDNSAINPNTHGTKKSVRSDTILFPDRPASSGRIKKYLRQRKDQISDASKPSSSTERTRRNPVQDKKVETEVANNAETPLITFNNDNTNFDAMNSEEFVSWTKDNLDSVQISDLLQQLDHTSEPEGSNVTGGADIQYNSFILVPHLKCPDGERMTHRGSCAPKYVHFSTPSPNHTKIRERTNKGNARKKLTQLLEALRKVENEARKALQESEATPDATVSETESEATTLSSVNETNR